MSEEKNETRAERTARLQAKWTPEKLQEMYNWYLHNDPKMAEPLKLIAQEQGITLEEPGDKA